MKVRKRGMDGRDVGLVTDQESLGKYIQGWEIWLLGSFKKLCTGGLIQLIAQTNAIEYELSEIKQY